METLYKQPLEVIDFTFDYTLMLADSDSLAATAPTISVANTASPAPSDDVLPVLGATWVNASTGMIKQRISGGKNKSSYKVTCLAGTTSGEVLEMEFRLKVKDA